MTMIKLQLSLFKFIKTNKPIIKYIDKSFQKQVKISKDSRSLYGLYQIAFEARHILYLFI